jgi:predicted nucleotidyltransferase
MRNSNPHQTIRFLKRWRKKLVGVSRAYVFGSLVNEDGVLFAPEESDIDLLLVLEARHHTAAARAGVLKGLLPTVERLETGLLRELGRSKADVAITSTSIATALEIEAEIHKDGAARFYSENRFNSLDSDDIPHVAFQQFKGNIPPELRQIFQAVQKERNAYLRATPNGNRLSPQHTGSEPIPKALMRASALLRYARGELTSEAKTDIGFGLTEFMSLLERYGSDCRQLRQIVHKHTTGRGHDVLSAEQVLLAWEILADAAYPRLEAEIRATPTGNSAHNWDREPDDLIRSFPRDFVCL